MNFTALLGITICSFFIISCSQVNPPSPPFDLNQEMDFLFQHKDNIPTETTGLQLVIIKNGNIIYENAKGSARITGKNKTPLTNEHKVRVASISKFVLTMAFMTLVEEEKVDLDADISNYINFELRNPHFPNRIITPRQVLSHTSSIRDASYYYMGPNEDFQDFFIIGTNPRSAEHFEQGKHYASAPDHGPEDYFTYSNLNFGIISAIVENVSGQRMDQFVKEKIFTPLNLQSSFNVCDLYENSFSKLATIYRKGNGGETWNPEGPWIGQVDDNSISCFYEGEKYQRGQTPDFTALNNYRIGKNPTLFSPQGGLRASAKDLAVIMKVLLNDGKYGSKQIISKSSIDQMMSVTWQYDDLKNNGHTGGEALLGDPKAAGMMTRYGLSTHIINLKDWGLSEHSRILFGHLGSAYGLQGQFWFDPITKDGFVALITGLGDDPDIPDNTIPLFAIEETVLRLGLKGMDNY